MTTASELPVNTVSETATPDDMAALIFGSGASVTSATYVGDPRAAGIYRDGDSVAPGITPGNTGIILSTGVAEDITNDSGEPNQNINNTTNNAGPDNVADYNAIAGIGTRDSATLDIDFIPDADTLTMDFVFSSDEYPEFENSIYQDFVAVWINGTLVPMEVGNGDIDPGNINTTTNINLYQQNQDDSFNTEMDGFTVTLSLTMNVNPGEVNSIRIATADVADTNYDTNLLIAADSVQTDIVAITDSVSVTPLGTQTIDVLSNDINNGAGTLTIKQINGNDVVAGDTIVLPTGQSVLLNADGTFTVTGDADVEDFNFTYTIDNGDDADVGFVNATTVPCFVAGTMIATPQGEQAVETLHPGDLVLTRDDGPQPLRWIGTRKTAAKGAFAPVLIRAGTFGAHRDVLVSPLHRVLIRDITAELLFGEAEVLVAARDLINDSTIRSKPGGMVTYVHLLFDRHQVVFSDGLETESYLPGPQTADSFAQDVVDEIAALFPELDPDTGLGYPAAARRTLKRFEADLLRAAQVA